MVKITVEELVVIITAQNQQAKAQIKGVQDQLSSFEAQSKKVTNSTTNYFKTMAKSIAAIGIGKIIKDSFKSGMDFVESENLFEVSFGDASKQAREWSESYSKALGLVASEQRKNAGTLYNMFSSMGIGKNSFGMATGLTELANDMASFYNLTSEEAFIKLKAGIIGEAEPLRAIGIIVDENTVKQYAYKMGIAETGKELTAQQKVLARYQAILAQTSNAQGDLARTMNSPANQLRRLQARFTEFKQQIGIAFIPLLNAVMPALAGTLQIITPAFVWLAKSISWVSSAIANASTPAKILLAVAVGCAIAIPLVTLATKAWAKAQALLVAVQSILIPQTITFSTVLKASLGWIALIAGAIGLLWGLFGNSSKDANKTAGAFDNTALSANKAASGIGNMSDKLDDLGKKTKQLASFDEIEVLNDENNGLMNNLLGTGWEDNFNNALNGIDDMKDSLSDLESAINLSDFWTSLSDVVSDSISWWKGVISDSLDWWGKLLGNIKDKIKGAFSWIKNDIVEKFNFIKSTFDNNPLFQTVKGWAEKIGGAIYNTINNSLNSVAERISDFFAKFDPDKLSKQASEFAAVGINIMFDNKKSLGFSASAFASGGFPDTGSLFIANEAGPEMVGTMGGKTAVANNSQIVDGIAAGVYRAIAPLAEKIANSNNGGDTYLDGTIISRILAPKINAENVRKGGNSSVVVL